MFLVGFRREKICGADTRLLPGQELGSGGCQSTDGFRDQDGFMVELKEAHS